MKTTLQIDDDTLRRLKEEAHRRGQTMSELVETALRLFLRRPRSARSLPSMPAFHGGRHLVEVADRDALDEAMGGRSGS